MAEPVDGRKVLLLDDSEIAREVERWTLSRAGFDVRTAATMAEFESLLAGWRPDVILTDVKMPELSGAEVCQYLKSRVNTANVPVVLFSVLPDGELGRLARTCGADGYLSKAHGVERLAEKLHEICEEIVW